MAETFLAHRRAYKPRPHYKRQRLTPQEYLCKQRVRLLLDIPPDHRLRSRVTSRRSGVLVSEDFPPLPPRHAFTDEELRNIKAKRRGVDPDDAYNYLQRSQLVQMWNAENVNESQWAEYDQAKDTMEDIRRFSGLPEKVFHSEDMVGEKRKRVVSAEYKPSPRRPKFALDEVDGQDSHGIDGDCQREELEEGEIEEDMDAVRTIEKQNEVLRAENEALRAAVGRAMVRGRSASPEYDLPVSPPISPPESDSGSDSDDDMDVEIDGDHWDLDELGDDVEEFDENENLAEKSMSVLQMLVGPKLEDGQGAWKQD